MIKSMTGHGRGEASGEGVSYEVELRGVNHRFLDLRFKLPQEISHFENDLRLRVTGVVRRGRVDVWVSRIATRDPEALVVINRGMVSKYMEAASAISGEFKVPGQLQLESLLALPGAVRIEIRKEQVENEKEIVEHALGNALDGFEATRRKEGMRLGQDLSERIRFVESDLELIEETALGMPQEYAARVRRRIGELLEGIPLDEARLAQEAAYLASRSDITEEIVRLRAHLKHALDCLSATPGPVGKSMDFLVQEMHREVNTIGSKAEDVRISQAVLRVKAEIEKVREQVQNLE
jgi:uncharacterized protein (TIGR00255 family)